MIPGTHSKLVSSRFRWQATVPVPRILKAQWEAPIRKDNRPLRKGIEFWCLLKRHLFDLLKDSSPVLITFHDHDMSAAVKIK